MAQTTPVPPRPNGDTIEARIADLEVNVRRMAAQLGFVGMQLVRFADTIPHAHADEDGGR